jgi:hypothetical protein
VNGDGCDGLDRQRRAAVTPRLLVVVALEPAPPVAVDAMNDAEERRLLDWVEAHPDYVEDVSIAYLSALELMRGARAA